MSDKFKTFVERTRFFNRNTTPKVVSIIFALVMWLYVMGEVNPEMVIPLNNISVQLMNVEDLNKSGLVIMGQQDYTVSVRIAGRRNDVYKVSPQDIIARADLRGFHKGTNSIPVEISGPPYITVQDVSPKQLKINLDEIVVRQKPVSVVTIGNAPAGFEPGDAVVSPKEVMVEGPESIVNSITQLIAEIPITDQLKEINDRIPLKAVNEDGKTISGVQISQRYVEVTLPILPTKEVPIVLEFQGKPKDNYKVTAVKMNPETVRIKGQREKLDGVAEIKARTIDIAGIDKTTERNMNLLVPEGVTLLNDSKNFKVTLTVERVLSKEFTYLRDEIAIDNVEAGHSIDLIKVPDNILVRVEAVESVINTIQRNDLQLYINADDLTEGKYSTDIAVSTAHKIEKITAIPSRIDFEVKRDKDPQSSGGGQTDTQDTN